MSSYVVSDRTINNILSGMEFSEHRNHFLRVMAEGELCVLGTKGQLQMLGHAMRELNVEAVKQRYDDPDDLLPSHPYHYAHELVTTIQALAALDGYLYQCCEGDVPETTLYQFLDRTVRATFMKDIIRRLPEYKAAKWG